MMESTANVLDRMQRGVGRWIAGRQKICTVQRGHGTTRQQWKCCTRQAFLFWGVPRKETERGGGL